MLFFSSWCLCSRKLFERRFAHEQVAGFLFELDSFSAITPRSCIRLTERASLICELETVFVLTTVFAARSFVVCLQSEVMLTIIFFVLAISLLQTECLLDAFLPGMRSYVRIDISLLDRVNLRRRAQVGTHEHLLMRANLTQKVVVKSDLVQLCNLVNPFVALVELGTLFHQDLQRLLEPEHFKELEILL